MLHELNPSHWTDWIPCTGSSNQFGFYQCATIDFDALTEYSRETNEGGQESYRDFFGML